MALALGKLLPRGTAFWDLGPWQGMGARALGVGSISRVEAAPSYCLPGQMLLSRGFWGLYLPSSLEDSVLRSPRMVLAPVCFPNKAF